MTYNKSNLQRICKHFGYTLNKVNYQLLSTSYPDTEDNREYYVVLSSLSNLFGSISYDLKLHRYVVTYPKVYLTTDKLIKLYSKHVRDVSDLVDILNKVEIKL